MRRLERSPSAVVSDTLGEQVRSSALINHQAHGKLCALNCVANGVDVRLDLYEAVEKRDPCLEQVVHALQDKCAEFRKPKGVNRVQLLQWLMEQADGVFAVEYNRHCLTWLAKEQLILDTDPRNKEPLRCWGCASWRKCTGLLQGRGRRRVAK